MLLNKLVVGRRLARDLGALALARRRRRLLLLLLLPFLNLLPLLIGVVRTGRHLGGLSQ